MNAAALRVSDSGELRVQVTVVLEGFLDRKASPGGDRVHVPDLVETLRDFVLAGGKRLRPVLCVLGWHAAAGQGDVECAVRVGAALEMFHAFALIHDDIMDDSSTRRGRPSAHRALAERHAGRAGAVRLGGSAAILLGDLAFVWSNELLHTVGLPADRFAAALPVLDAMRTELVFGQYLDLVAAGRPGPDVDAALRIARFKSGRYTVERPLQLGAVIAGAEAGLCSSLSAFAVPLGEAFQLRDDLLGVFGDPAATGKPVLDDLREGKQTVLVALAFQRADDAGRRLLETLLGRADLTVDQADEIRRVVWDSGAHAAVEHLIATRREESLRALASAGLPPAVAVALRVIAVDLTERTS